MVFKKPKVLRRRNVKRKTGAKAQSKQIMALSRQVSIQYGSAAHILLTHSQLRAKLGCVLFPRYLATPTIQVILEHLDYLAITSPSLPSPLIPKSVYLPTQTV